MTFNISEALKRTFDLAGLRHQATQHLNGQGWQSFQSIRKKYDDLRQDEQARYKDEYDTRFEVARKRRLNEAGTKTRDFKPRWFGRDQFDDSAINRQAQRDVENQHHQLMTGIDDMEIRDTNQLVARSAQRHKARERTKHDFNKTADRRQTPDRRLNPRQR